MACYDGIGFFQNNIFLGFYILILSQLRVNGVNKNGNRLNISYCSYTSRSLCIPLCLY